ncbi:MULTISPECIES: (2Fe-2S)-binding protein [Desulfosporosinus]|uniref:putative iron-sulfur cluster-binding metallochaperone n=1 Tax=Desulfosporosinus TaxID=79206 RepID=UPI00094C7195|nr:MULTISPECIES: (2Fe-2S)-binding protein [Desulfosporosinus]
MEGCCAIQIEPIKFDFGYSCPECGDKGRPMKIITLKSLLVPSALAKLEPSVSYKMCTNKACSVVYFSEKQDVFETKDMKVEVYTKSDDEDCPVCYCFGWTKKRVIQEFEETGRTTALEEIIVHTKAGRCGCEVNNPEGSCCIGNIKRLLESITKEG